MKNLFRTFSLTVALAAAIFAQGRFGPRDANGTAPDPAAMIARQVERLTTLLDLTTAQAAQVTSILTAAQSSASTIQSGLATTRDSLQTAITANSTATIDQLAAAIGLADGQLLAIRARSEAGIYVLLTPDQQTKLKTLGGIDALGGGPGGRGPGRPGPGGPRP